MALQQRSAAPGKARRAASAGKPKRAKKTTAVAPKCSATKSTSKSTSKKGPGSAKPRHTAEQKAARKGTSARAQAELKTTRYADVDTTKTSKKVARNVERSKLRAKRYQEKIGSKTKERVLKDGTVIPGRAPKKSFRDDKPRTARPERNERTDRAFKSERPNAKHFDFQKSDTRPTTRRDAAKARANDSDGRPNFVPQKREKFVPGSKPRTERAKPTYEVREPRAYKSDAKKPPRDRRESPAYGREDRYSKTHSRAAVDFGEDDNYISENLADANLIEATPNSEVTTTFRELGIAPALANALSAQGITTPFPIQVATLPEAIAGYDILGRGQTGSGKTLAFGLALLTRLSGQQAKPHKPLALVLTPTRELAQQIDEVLTPLARVIGHESVVVAGGMSYSKQITAMRRATAILVATPGRLIDLLNKGEVQLDQLQITVLDEADQMADMGFLPVVKEILDQAKPDGQRLLFSATLDRGVDALVKNYLKNPKTHSLQNDRASVKTMQHYVLVCQPGDKDEIVNQIAARHGKTILFVKTQRGGDRVGDKLAHSGVAVGTLHGGKSQAVRTRTLALFKETEDACLVATDVAARGIHVDGISLVVHVDAPQDHKDYLHRSGRTARAGTEGVVVSIATTKQRKSAASLLSRAGVTATFVDVAPLSKELVAITGAQEPSGIPYVAPVLEKKPAPRRRTQGRPGNFQRRDRAPRKR